jgi:hypothetical protein
MVQRDGCALWGRDAGRISRAARRYVPTITASLKWPELITTLADLSEPQMARAKCVASGAREIIHLAQQVHRRGLRSLAAEIVRASAS